MGATEERPPITPIAMPLSTIVLAKPQDVIRHISALPPMRRDVAIAPFPGEVERVRLFQFMARRGWGGPVVARFLYGAASDGQTFTYLWPEGSE